MDILRNNDRKWELILNNLKELTTPGSQDWCINAGKFNQCVPNQLETHDGVPYNCLKPGGQGEYGEVLIYNIQPHRPSHQEGSENCNQSNEVQGRY